MLPGEQTHVSQTDQQTNYTRAWPPTRASGKNTIANESSSWRCAC